MKALTYRHQDILPLPMDRDSVYLTLKMGDTGLEPVTPSMSS